MLAFNSGLQDAQMLHLQSQPVFLAQPEFSYAEEFLQNLVSKNCSIDEAKNRLGANQCRRNSQCQGDRFCSPAGWCQGVSNCNEQGEQARDCSIDEAANFLGEN
mmetsp:Transcript_19055/g.32530  ORF Transcript_19055/g.32530 Transcript_19055/m.32530 type:complete len:104 (-) Transcript_19055:164-475(-)